MPSLSLSSIKASYLSLRSYTILIYDGRQKKYLFKDKTKELQRKRERVRARDYRYLRSYKSFLVHPLAQDSKICFGHLNELSVCFFFFCVAIKLKRTTKRKYLFSKEYCNFRSTIPKVFLEDCMGILQENP